MSAVMKRRMFYFARPYSGILMRQRLTLKLTLSRKGHPAKSPEIHLRGETLHLNPFQPVQVNLLQGKLQR